MRLISLKNSKEETKSDAIEKRFGNQLVSSDDSQAVNHSAGSIPLKIVSVLAVLFIVACIDGRVLFSSNVAVGLDGYYYVTQIDSMMNSKFAYPISTPLVIFYLAGLKLLLGDTVSAVKVGSIVMNLLLMLGIIGVILRTTESWLLAVFGGLYSGTASLHFFMVGEFLNNLGAVVSIVFGLFCLLSASPKKKIWFGLAAFFFLTSLACHRSAIAILFGSAFFTFLAYWLFSTIRKAWVVCLLVSIYIAPFLCALFFANALPGELVIEFNKFPNLPFTKQTIYDVMLLSVASSSILFMLNRHDRLDTTQMFMAGLSLLSIVIHLNIFINPIFFAQAPFGRFQILTYIEVSLLIPYLLSLLSHKSYAFALFLFLALLPLLWLSVRNPLPVSLQTDFLADRALLVRGISQAVLDVPRDALIIAPHGDQFAITAVTGIASQNKMPEIVDADSNYVLLRFIPAANLNYPAKTVFNNPRGYGSVILKLEKVPQYIKNIETPQRKRVLFDNPHIRKYIERSIESGVE